MSVEFTRYRDGTCALRDGDELLWSSDNDDDFLEEFDAHIDSDDIEDVIEYLEDSGYLDSEEVDVVDEDEPGTRTVEPLTLDDEDDEEGEAWQH